MIADSVKKKNLAKAAVLLMSVVFLLCAGCGGRASGPTDSVPVVLDQAEYVLYQNIFYSDFGQEYVDTQVTKNGVLGVLRDAFSDRVRYYVWGYMDNTMCCDWQWEFVPDAPDALPPAGSLVTVTGIFAENEDALDGYWIEDAAVVTETTYTGDTAEVNMLAMSCTLERVQMLNILYHPESFEGAGFLAYGRIAGIDALEDPYYDGSWQIGFTTDQQAPAIGTIVSLSGTIEDGVLSDCALEVRG